MTDLRGLHDQLDDLLQDQVRNRRVAGAVVGVARADEDVAVACGSANLNTGQPFTTDTGFLLGSVTKVLTTTALLRQVERGAVDLDRPVAQYVPEFRLRDADAAAQITVRMLLNHTNGIDADALVPSAVRGRDASRSYVETLTDFDVLFEPGSWVHYSNPGFVLAARVLEQETGLPFERAIQEQLFGPCGMHDATAVQTQAFLRRTAVGAFADPRTGELRATELFTLGEGIAGSGSTPIVTVADLLAFGRMHLSGGVAATGTRVLADEWVTAMRTPTFDTGLPQVPPVGLGWWIAPVAGTTALCHSGGSPNGQSMLLLLPEHDISVACFATGPGRFALHDLVATTVIEELTGRPATFPIELSPGLPDPAVAGEYASFQSRLLVELEGEVLVVTETFEPYDEEHRKQLGAFDGAALDRSTVRYGRVAPHQFAPVGLEPTALGGLFGRMALLAALPAEQGRPAGIQHKLRFTPRVSSRA